MKPEISLKLLLRVLVLSLAFTLHAKVPGAATSTLPVQAGIYSRSAAVPLVRQLDAELRALVATLHRAALPEDLSTLQQLEKIEALWQQLFAQQSSPALNKVYNQYQVQLQLLRRPARPETHQMTPQDARQLDLLRQRLLSILTYTAA